MVADGRWLLTTVESQGAHPRKHIFYLEEIFHDMNTLSSAVHTANIDINSCLKWLFRGGKSNGKF